MGFVFLRQALSVQFCLLKKACANVSTGGNRGETRNSMNRLDFSTAVVLFHKQRDLSFSFAVYLGS